MPNMESNAPELSYRQRFFSGPFQYFEDTLNALLLRRRAIAQNIANVNNPNYHPVHVEFEKELEQIYHNWWKKHGVDSPDGLEIAPIMFDFDPEFKSENLDSDTLQPVVTQDPVGRVDLNYEMGELYKTQLQYNAIAENGRPSYGRDVLDQMLK